MGHCPGLAGRWSLCPPRSCSTKHLGVGEGWTSSLHPSVPTSLWVHLCILGSRPVPSHLRPAWPSPAPAPACCFCSAGAQAWLLLLFPFLLFLPFFFLLALLIFLPLLPPPGSPPCFPPPPLPLCPPALPPPPAALHVGSLGLCLPSPMVPRWIHVQSCMCPCPCACARACQWVMLLSHWGGGLTAPFCACAGGAGPAHWAVVLTCRRFSSCCSGHD